MAKSPRRSGEMRVFYPVWQVTELAAGCRYTTPSSPRQQRHTVVFLLTLASLYDTIGSCDRVTLKPRGCGGAASITRMARLQPVRTTAPVGRLVPAPGPTCRSLPALPGV